MFDNLSERLQGAFKKLSGRARISEAVLNESLREVRIALLEADVNLSVVKTLLGAVRATAQMISYEVTMGLSVVGLFMVFGTLKLTDMGVMQDQTFRLLGFIETFGWGTVPACSIGSACPCGGSSSSPSAS